MEALGSSGGAFSKALGPVAAFACGLAAGWALHAVLRRAKAAVAAPVAPPAGGADPAVQDPDPYGLCSEDSVIVPEDVDLKMVIAVRQDLNMSKGKTAAQVGHAVLACWQQCITTAEWREWAKAWNFRAAAKITLKVDDEAQLDTIAAAAEAAGLPCAVIEDAGRTEIPAGSRTVLGIGPAPKALIDKITGPKGAYPLRLLT